jgi:hypothetical protein
MVSPPAHIEGDEAAEKATQLYLVPQTFSTFKITT